MRRVIMAAPEWFGTIVAVIASAESFYSARKLIQLVETGLLVEIGKISSSEISQFGWGGRIRTFTILINSEVSYRLDHAPTSTILTYAVRT